MKTFFQTVTNTYKLVKLLGNPDVSSYLELQLKHEGQRSFSKTHEYVHKHYVVDVLN